MQIGIHVIQSQDLDHLLTRLGQFLSVARSEPASLLKSQDCIVPNYGVGEWLKNRLAQQQGIVANVHCVAPRTFQWELYSRTLGGSRISQTPQLLNMKWRIVAYLQQYLDVDELTSDHPLSSILARLWETSHALTDPSQKRQKRQLSLFWLADHVSRLFANYVIYRGQCVSNCQGQCRCRQNWLAAWGNNQSIDLKKNLKFEDRPKSSDSVQVEAIEFHELNQTQKTNDRLYPLQQAMALERWQRFLWLEIFAQDYAAIQALENEFWHRLQQGYVSGLPKQVYVFTIQQLAPSQLNFLRRLGQYCTVIIFNYTPTQEYWADSVDPRWQREKVLQHPDLALYYESRHPLLTRLGKQARDNNALLAQLAGGEEGLWEDEFTVQPLDSADSSSLTVLQRIQHDILHLDPVTSASRMPLDRQDQSIQFHVCYSLQRQLEVLKDQLIGWFGTHSPPYQPRDVVVLLPDLTAAEPLIRTVFARDTSLTSNTLTTELIQSVDLPIRIAGVAQQEGLRLWQALTKRLSLLQGRFGIDDWLDYMGLMPVQMRYGLTFEEVQRLSDLLQCAGFKRGFDDAHLAQSLSEHDDDRHYTFAYALERLALSMTMPESIAFEGILALSEQIQVDDFNLIAIAMAIFDDIDRQRHRLNEIQSIATYSQDLLNDLAVYEQVTGYTQVYQTIQEFNRAIRYNAQPDVLKLPLQTVIDDITNTLSSKLDKTAPSGYITFAQMGQLRTLPYALVVCLNLDSGHFPRRDQQLAFDLMAVLKGELGDRSRLDDDQGAFLDALLQAQREFWVFYNGFDIADHQPRDPSSVVQELIQHLGQLIEPDAQPHIFDATTASKLALPIAPSIERLFHIHPLYPFDPNGFSPSTYRFEDQWFEVAKQLLQPTQSAHWLDQITLPSKEHYTTATNVDWLDSNRWINDLTFPPRAFYRNMGLKMVEMREQGMAFEPLVANKLDDYRLLKWLHTRDIASADTLLQAQDELVGLSEIDQEQLQDLLPVGRVRSATVRRTQDQYHTLTQQVTIYGPLTQTTRHEWYDGRQHWYIEKPDLGCTHWISVSIGKLNPKRLLHVWLQYALWVASHPNEDPQMADIPCFERTALFRDTTLRLKGLSCAQAKQVIHDWYSAWQFSQHYPLFLPPELWATAQLLKHQEPLFDVYTGEVIDLKFYQPIKQQWLGQKSYYNSFHTARTDEGCSLHPHWALLLAPDQAEAAFHQAVRQWARKLYDPLRTHIAIHSLEKA